MMMQGRTAADDDKLNLQQESIQSFWETVLFIVILLFKKQCNATAIKGLENSEVSNIFCVYKASRTQIFKKVGVKFY